jgi:hypothetical protein
MPNSSLEFSREFFQIYSSASFFLNNVRITTSSSNFNLKHALGYRRSWPSLPTPFISAKRLSERTVSHMCTDLRYSASYKSKWHSLKSFWSKVNCFKCLLNTAWCTILTVVLVPLKIAFQFFWRGDWNFSAVDEKYFEFCSLFGHGVAFFWLILSTFQRIILPASSIWMLEIMLLLRSSEYTSR